MITPLLFLLLTGGLESEAVLTDLTRRVHTFPQTELPWYTPSEDVTNESKQLDVNRPAGALSSWAEKMAFVHCWPRNSCLETEFFRDPNTEWNGTGRATFLASCLLILVAGCLIVHLWGRVAILHTELCGGSADRSATPTYRSHPPPEAEDDGAEEAEVSEGPYPKYRAESRVVDLFEEQARERPQATAVVVLGAALTYKELLSVVCEVADTLAANGATAGTIAALVLDRSIGQLVAVLAVLKSGAAFLPVALNCPLERKRLLLEDSKAVVVVGASGDNSTAHLAGESCIAFVAVPEDGSLGKVQVSLPQFPRGSPGPRLLQRAPAEDMALLIYTSGTTGTPKGIVYDHRHLTHGVHFFAEHCEMGTGSVGLLKSPYVLAVVEYELFPALTRGGQVVVACPGAHQNPTILANTIRNQAVTVLVITPQVLEFVLDMHEAHNEVHAPPSLGTLEHIVTVGEHLSSSLANRVVSMSGIQARLHNFYGASESSCTIYTVPSSGVDVRRFPNNVPAGRPQPHTSVYIMVEGRSQVGAPLYPVPRGGMGEICFGGVTAARYWKQEELSEEKWRDTAEFGRLFCTGDLGRWRFGMLEVIGRKDRQVKINGVRIEPEEVEAVLLKLGTGSGPPALREVAVVASEEPAVLTAFASRREGVEALTEEMLRDHCRSTLPAAYIPGRFVLLPHLPRLPNGKTNLLELREVARMYRDEESQMVMDSLGQMKRLSKAALFETAVMHRCYTVWMFGVLTDHLCVCAGDFESYGTLTLMPLCKSLALNQVPPWVEMFVRSIGNDQDMFGFMMFGAYKDARPVDGQPRVGFGARDLRMALIYLVAGYPLTELINKLNLCFPTAWRGRTFPGQILNLKILLLSRAYLAICEVCRIPGWLQSLVVVGPCLLAPEQAFNLCEDATDIGGANGSQAIVWIWGSCNLFDRWLQFYIALYVVCFHFSRPVADRTIAVLPKGPTWGALALSLSVLLGVVMAMYHYPNSNLEGEQKAGPLSWAVLEVAVSGAQPALLAWGMAYVPLNLAWWGNTTLGTYVVHFYFVDQFAVLIVFLAELLAFDPSGLLLLLGVLLLIASVQTVLGPAFHYFLIGVPRMVWSVWSVASQELK